MPFCHPPSPANTQVAASGSSQNLIVDEYGALWDYLQAVGPGGRPAVAGGGARHAVQPPVVCTLLWSLIPALFWLISCYLLPLPHTCTHIPLHRLSIPAATTIDVILDNSGMELYTDLVLADFLLAAGLAQHVRLHGKALPWFVSDVMTQDLDAMMGWVAGEVRGARGAVADALAGACALAPITRRACCAARPVRLSVLCSPRWPTPILPLDISTYCRPHPRTAWRPAGGRLGGSACVGCPLAGPLSLWALDL